MDVKLIKTNLPLAGVAARRLHNYTSGGAGGRVYRNRNMKAIDTVLSRFETYNETGKVAYISRAEYVAARNEHTALVAVAEAAKKICAHLDATAVILPCGASPELSGEFKQALANLAAVRGGKIKQDGNNYQRL
jgi:hypothetical protein